MSPAARGTRLWYAPAPDYRAAPLSPVRAGTPGIAMAPAAWDRAMRSPDALTTPLGLGWFLLLPLSLLFSLSLASEPERYWTFCDVPRSSVRVPAEGRPSSTTSYIRESVLRSLRKVGESLRRPTYASPYLGPTHDPLVRRVYINPGIILIIIQMAILDTEKARERVSCLRKLLGD